MKMKNSVAIKYTKNHNGINKSQAGFVFRSLNPPLIKCISIEKRTWQQLHIM